MHNTKLNFQIYEQKKEVYGLLKVCGHDHDTLKKVIKCVISKVGGLMTFRRSASNDVRYGGLGAIT